ncbi:hypothetical protein [Herbaspirillum huttiense]|uniref:hypothetical protein n=1 Tax=Herbaspirillum huttiense TaxID=863372 RepID=UPI0039B0E25E
MFFGCCVTARYPVVIEFTALGKRNAKEINRLNHLFRLPRALPPLFLPCSCAVAPADADVFIIVQDISFMSFPPKKCKYIFIFTASKEKILSKIEYPYNAPEARDSAHEMHRMCAR